VQDLRPRNYPTELRARPAAGRVAFEYPSGGATADGGADTDSGTPADSGAKADSGIKADSGAKADGGGDSSGSSDGCDCHVASVVDHAGFLLMVLTLVGFALARRRY